MFIAVFGIIGVLGFLIGTFLQGVDNTKRKNSAEIKGKTEYYDHFGTERDIKTNTPLYLTHINGDRVLTDWKGKVYRNISEEQRIKDINKKLNSPDYNGETALYWNHKVEEVAPNVFRKVKYLYDTITKDIIIEIQVPDFGFPEEIRTRIKENNIYAREIKICVYMNRQGKFIRLDDFGERRYRKCEGLVEDILGYLNELQNKYINKYNRITYDYEQLKKVR